MAAVGGSISSYYFTNRTAVGPGTCRDGFKTTDEGDVITGKPLCTREPGVNGYDGNEVIGTE